MKIDISKKNWSIDAVYRRKGRINPKPQYQRTPVWNQRKKQLGSVDISLSRIRQTL